MKRINLAAAMTVLGCSLAASACPNLTGLYDCGGLGVMVSISDEGGGYRFFQSRPFSSVTTSYLLSKTGGSSSAPEGIDGKDIVVTSVCDGDRDFRIDAEINDSVVGPAHMTKLFTQGPNGSVRKTTVFRLSDGSTRNGEVVVCGREQN